MTSSNNLHPGYGAADDPVRLMAITLRDILAVNTVLPKDEGSNDAGDCDEVFPGVLIGDE